MNVWEANEKVTELLTRLKQRDACIDILIEQSLGKSKRNSELHEMNEELDTHVHQLQARLVARNRIVAEQDAKLEAIADLL